MSVERVSLTSVFAALLISTATSHSASAADTQLNIQSRWAGTFRTGQLNVLPLEQRLRRVGYLNDRKTWTRVWSAWKPDQKCPAIHFNEQLVVLIKNVRYLNRLSDPRATLSAGKLLVRAAETRSTRPIRSRVHCVLFSVPRAGIKWITDTNGEPLEVKTPTASKTFTVHPQIPSVSPRPQSACACGPPGTGYGKSSRPWVKYEPVHTGFFRDFYRGTD